MGSDINIQNLGSGTFAIRVTVYRDCNGIPLGYSPIAIKSKCGNYSHSNGSGPINGADVTPVCKNSCTKCTSSGCAFAFGVEQYYFDDTVNLSSVNCCDFVVDWEQCCRNSAITTGASSQNYYIESTFDKCKLKGNAPVFEFDPIILTCKNQCVNRYQSAKSQDGDSLVYYLTDPLSGSGATIPYNSGYTSYAPFKYVSYPDTSASVSNCKGFHFDQHTGLMRFTPTNEEVTVYTVRVDQWQKDSGKWIKVSQVCQDVQTSVVACAGSNTSPVISGIDGNTPTSATAAVGKAFCFTVKTFDADNSDSLLLNWNKGISGATFTTSTKRLPDGKFCWTPDSTTAGKTFSFIVSTEEKNVCPIPTKVDKAFTIMVLDTMPPFRMSGKDSGCFTRCYTVKPASTVGLSGLTYEWKVNGVIQSNTTDKLCYTFTSSKKYVIQCTVSKNKFFPQVLKDSIDVKLPVANAGRDTMICYGDSVRLSASGGKTYQWKAAPGLATTTQRNPWVKPLSNQQYMVTAFDSNGCPAKDSVFITVKKVNTVISAPATVCLGDAVSISASGASVYKWMPDPALTTTAGSSDATISPVKNTWFKLVSADSASGCSRLDSVYVTIDTNCVWPGDANYNKKVELTDLFNVGLVYGSIGTDRHNATNDFRPQASADWGSTLKGVDYKHIDCSGDGFINYLDTVAIARNLGKSHKKEELLDNDVNGVPIYYQLNKDTFFASDTVNATVMLGNQSKPAGGAYGIMLGHDISDKWMVSGSYVFNLDCGLFCDKNGVQLSLYRPVASSGSEAIVRIDRKASVGFGKLAAFSFIFKDSTAGYNTKGEWVHFNFTDAKLIDRFGNALAYNALNDSVLVYRSKRDVPTGIKPAQDLGHILVYPNPANDKLFVEFTNVPGSIEMVNLLGQCVYTGAPGKKSNKEVIDIAKLPPGVYTVVLRYKSTVQSRQIVIQR
jgi:hypothetical protein